MSFTPTQETVMGLVNKSVTDNERLFILWYGGIRAGKTYGMVRAGIEHSLNYEDSNYIVGGYVIRSIINNIAPYFKQICEELDLKYKIVEGGVNPRCEIGTNKFLFYGGDRSGRSNNVQGATARGLLLDEFELLDRNFVKQCEGRISNDNALRIYTSNKGQPYSWAKLEYFDRVKKGLLDAVLVDSNPEENNFIGGDFWEEKKNEYDDYYKRRFIDNEFTLENEPLYNPERISKPDDMNTPDIITIYSFARHHFSIPFFKIESKWVIGNVKGEKPPINILGINPYAMVLINSEASRLGRDFQNAYRTVRGYSDMFQPYQYEICQRAFDKGNVVVLDDAEHTIQAIDTYAVAGDHTTNPEISAIESTIEYLARVNRWQ